MKTERFVKDSHVFMTEIILPNDTNQLGNLLGGRLMHWIDIAAAIAAFRHCGRVCVTASVDEINFHHPVRLGEIVTLTASINRAFRTSMEAGVMVMSEGPGKDAPLRANNAYLTFVAIDKDGRPVPVPQIIPETEDERRRYEEAMVRRQHRLSRRQSG